MILQTRVSFKQGCSIRPRAMLESDRGCLVVRAKVGTIKTRCTTPTTLVDGSKERDELGRCIAFLLFVACFFFLCVLDVYWEIWSMPKEEHNAALRRRVQAFLFIWQAFCEIMAICQLDREARARFLLFSSRLGSSSRTVLLQLDRNSQLGHAATVRVGKSSRQAIIVFHKPFMYVNAPHPSNMGGVFGPNTSRPYLLRQSLFASHPWKSMMEAVA